MSMYIVLLSFELAVFSTTLGECSESSGKSQDFQQLYWNPETLHWKVDHALEQKDSKTASPAAGPLPHLLA